MELLLHQQNVLTVAKYQGWDVLPKDAIIGSIRTVFKESHRLPDEWSFSIKEEGLFDETRGDYVHKIVKDYPHPNKYLRELEDGIISAMDRWAISDQQGYLVWISPSFKDHYPCHKIEIIHKNESGTKTDNMVILFDGDQDVCLAVAKQIFSDLKGITNVEELRNSLITPPVLDINRIIEIVGPHIPTSESAMNEAELELRIEHIANLAMNGAAQSTIAYEMDRVGIIGKHSFSCPGGGLSNTLFYKSNVIEAKYVKNCGQCGTTIEAHIVKGYKCPNCGGIYEGC